MDLTAGTIPSANSTGAPYVAGNFRPSRTRSPPSIWRCRSGPRGADRSLSPDRPQSGRSSRTWCAWYAITGSQAPAWPMASGCAAARRNGSAVACVLDRNAAKGLGRPAIPGRARAVATATSTADLMSVDEKLCAVVEAGSIPVELDYELESVRRTDFQGTLEAGFTGHPKFDPITGEQHALTYEPFQAVCYVSVDRDGRATTKARIDLPRIPLIHDMAFTQSYIIVPDFPVTFQPEHSHTTFPWLWDEPRTPASASCRGAGMPLASSGSKRRAASRFTSRMPTTMGTSPSSICPGTGVCSSPIRTDPMKVRPSWCGDAPSPVRAIDRDSARRPRQRVPADQWATRPASLRYIYTAHWGDDVTFGPAMKHDLLRGTTEVHDYGRGRKTSEPVIVRKPGASAEDEGWIMSYVYDPERDLSDVVILDAQDFAGEPIATIRLPVRVPFGFHGGWAPDVNPASVVA